MQEYVSMKEVKKILGVSSDSLRRWDKKGILKSYRSPGGHRYFLKSDLETIGANYSPRIKVKPVVKKTVTTIKPVYLYILMSFVILNIVLFAIYIYN